MAPHWGAVHDDGCVKGQHQYSARLWNINGPWREACFATPGPAGSAVAGLTPDECDDKGVLGEWGVWSVPDTACAPHWGPLSDAGCSEIGKRKYSAILVTSPGADWETDCKATKAPPGSPVGERPPDYCVKVSFAGIGIQQWGEWLVPDVACTPRWGAVAGRCVADGQAVYSAILENIPAGTSWDDACHVTKGPEGSAVAGRLPDRCSQPLPGLNEWGEWDAQDASCHCVLVTNTQCYPEADCTNCADSITNYDVPVAQGRITQTRRYCKPATDNSPSTPDWMCCLETTSYHCGYTRAGSGALTDAPLDVVVLEAGPIVDAPTWTPEPLPTTKPKPPQPTQKKPPPARASTPNRSPEKGRPPKSRRRD